MFRESTWLVFLIPLVGFTNFARLAPIPSFWPQWLVSWGFLLLVAGQLRHLSWGRAAGTTMLSPFSWAWVGVAALLLLQSVSGVLLAPEGAILVLAVAVLAVAVHEVSRRCSSSMVGWTERVHVSWAWGTTVALLLAGAQTALASNGLDVVYLSVYDAPVPPRAWGGFGQPNQFGVFVALAAASIRFLHQSGRLSPMTSRALIFFAAALVTASGSRAALLVWLLLLSADWVVSHRNGGQPGAGARVVWHRVFAEVALLAIFQVLWAYWAALQPLHVASTLRANHGMRIEIIRDVVQLLAMHPFGVGFDGLANARLYELSSPLSEPGVANAHNLFLHLLVVFGWPALVPIGCICWWAVRCVSGARLSSGNGSTRAHAFAWVAGVSAYSLVEFPLWYAFFSLPLAMFSGFLLPIERAVGLPDGNGQCHTKGQSEGANRLGLAVLVSGSLMLALVAVDLQRFRMAVDMLASKQASGQKLSVPEMRSVAELHLLTLFPSDAKHLWLGVLGSSDDFAQEKYKLAHGLVQTNPSVATVGNYVIAATRVGKVGEAAQMMNALERRSPQFFRALVVQLRIKASQSNNVDKLLEQLESVCAQSKHDLAQAAREAGKAHD